MLITIEKVIKLTGLSRATVYLHMAKHNFPKSISICTKTNKTGWVESEVQNWIKVNFFDDKRHLTLAQVKDLTGLSQSSIYRLMLKKSFPQKIKIYAPYLKKIIVTWPAHEVNNWVEKGELKNQNGDVKKHIVKKGNNISFKEVNPIDKFGSKLILSGKTNEEAWDALKKQFKLNESQKHLPVWYRMNLKRAGLIS